MGLPFESLKWVHHGVFALLFAALSGCAAQVIAASAAAAPLAAGITEIRLEAGCFGCATGSSLVLRRDGSASFTVTGNARHGTADATSRATLALADFDALAERLVMLGYFGFDETYQDPEIQDGAWAAMSVVRNGMAKSVFRRNDAGPPSLSDAASAIEAAKMRLSFVPERR